ncbi:MAG: DUF3185 family protein [Gammaproteobacteria bacterium]|jgi:drug/metabolite transporter (DMT)-like permease|nr:DUF3185 family protein [Gammaproteobacteria bacterium]
MTTKRIIGLALLAAGLVLLFLGYQSSQGMDDRVSEALTGEYTDSTVWYWVLGAISSAAGVAMLVLGRD